MQLGVSYIPAHLPWHIERDLGELAEIGCTDVLFAIQENHFDTLHGPLTFGPELARRAGLRPQAVIWGLLNTFGGGRMSTIMLRDTSLWRVGRGGAPEPMACLNNPGVIDHLEKLIVRLRDAGFETFFIDEPTPQDCLCAYCQQAFRRQFGEELSPTEGDDRYRAFQRQTVIDYIRRGCACVKRVDPKLQTTCCLMSHDRACWREAARVRELDMLAADPYWLIPFLKLSFAQAMDDAKLLKQICGEEGKRSQLWLNCWGIPANVEQEIYRGGRELAAIGFDSLFTWSYRGGLGTNEQCARPDVAWEQVRRLYRELARERS